MYQFNAMCHLFAFCRENVLNIMLRCLSKGICVLLSYFRIWGNRFWNFWVQFQWIMVFTSWLLLHLYGMKGGKTKILLGQRYVYITVVTSKSGSTFKWFSVTKKKIQTVQWKKYNDVWTIFVFLISNCTVREVPLENGIILNSSEEE